VHLIGLIIKKYVTIPGHRNVKKSCLFLAVNKQSKKLPSTKGTPICIFVIGADDGSAFLAETCSLYSSLILCFVD
jgi:hypothetical protein